MKLSKKDIIGTIISHNGECHIIKNIYVFNNDQLRIQTDKVIITRPLSDLKKKY